MQLNDASIVAEVAKPREIKALIDGCDAGPLWVRAQLETLACFTFDAGGLLRSLVQRLALPFPGPALSCGSCGAAWPGAVVFGRGCRVASLREIEGNQRHHAPYSSIGSSLAHLRLLRIAQCPGILPGRLRSLGHRLPGAPPRGGIASVSWGLIATMNRSDSLPRQSPRVRLPGSSAGCPGLGKVSLGHALIRSHRASGQLPDGLPCGASPSLASSPTRPGRLTVRFTLRPNVCRRPFTKAPHGASAAVFGFLDYGGISITRIPPAGFQPAG